MAEVKKKSIAIIAHGGTLDCLYPIFILASSAASMDWEIHVYFTFWGLNTLIKGAMEKVGLPVDYKHLEAPMRERLKQMNYPTPYEMLKRLKESGLLKIYACSPTMEMLGVKKEDLIPEVDKIVGAATFLDLAAKADITLFI